MRAEQLTDPITFHAEGPVWSPAWGGLRWVDMLAGDLLTLRADGSVDRRHVGEVAACVRPRRGGGAVIGIERGFALEEPDGSVTGLPPVWDDPSVRMNEGACDPDGGFWCGSMAYDQRTGGGRLYRLDPDGAVAVGLAGVTVSNGLDWSPDGTLAYYADTATHRVDVFDWSGGALTERRPFVTFTDDVLPDGLTVDAEGAVWVALNGRGEVHRYTSDGALDGVVTVPTPQVTACTLGGDELDTLFLTTSRENLPADAEPLAGAVFSVRVGVRGVPVRAFTG